MYDPMYSLFFLYCNAHLCQQALNVRADHASNGPSARKEDKRWNALDDKAGGHEHVFVGIHLRETQLALVGTTEPCIERG